MSVVKARACAWVLVAWSWRSAGRLDANKKNFVVVY